MHVGAQEASATVQPLDSPNQGHADQAGRRPDRLTEALPARTQPTRHTSKAQVTNRYLEPEHDRQNLHHAHRPDYGGDRLTKASVAVIARTQQLCIR